MEDELDNRPSRVTGSCTRSIAMDLAKDWRRPLGGEPVAWPRSSAGGLRRTH